MNGQASWQSIGQQTKSALLGSMLLLSAIYASAGAAKAGTGLRDPCILWCEGVTVVAMSATSEASGGVIAAENVYLHRDRIDVIGVHAPRMAAKMIWSQSVRKGPPKNPIVGKTNGADLLFPAPESGIVAAVARLVAAMPTPATTEMFLTIGQRSIKGDFQPEMRLVHARHINRI